MSGLANRLNRPVVAILAVTAIAGGIRFWHLSSPHALVFDEVYYPKVACIYVGLSDHTCKIISNDEQYWRAAKWDVGSWVHPPLGKWQIALGIKAFGMTPFGWRVASAVAGTLVVVGLALIVQLMLGSALWTFIAGLLLATEFLDVVESRTGLLDVHQELWIVAGFLAIVLDRRWIERADRRLTAEAEPPGPEPPGPEPAEPPRARTASPVWRPWRVAAGAAFGAAAAVKWSGAMAIPAALLLAYWWETSRRKDAGARHPFARSIAQETFGIVIWFLLLPAAVYFLTWLPWFNHEGLSLLHHPAVALDHWWAEHQAMWNFHKDLKEFKVGSGGTLTPTHPYYSRPWSWLPMVRPVSYFVRDLGPDIRQIIAIGNPAIFWASVWTLPYAGYIWWTRRDWRGGFVLIVVASQYLPWFAVSRPQFFFYVLPITPFLVLAAVLALHDLADARIVLRDETGAVAVDPETGAPAVSRKRPFRPFVWAYVVAAVGLFVWFWPVLSGGRLTRTLWHARIWFRGWV